MTKKTIAERLREPYEVFCIGSFASMALEGKPATCVFDGDKFDCKTCHEEWKNKLADAIEAEQRSRTEQNGLPEGIEWPRFDDGTPVKFGDEYENAQGRKSEVQCIQFTANGFKINRGQKRNVFQVYGEPVKRPDTFESVVGEMLADFDGSDSIELDGYFARLRNLMGGE